MMGLLEQKITVLGKPESDFRFDNALIAERPSSIEDNLSVSIGEFFIGEKDNLYGFGKTTMHLPVWVEKLQGTLKIYIELVSIKDPSTCKIVGLTNPLIFSVEIIEGEYEAYCEYFNISASAGSLTEVTERISEEFFSLYRELEASDDLYDDALRLRERFREALGKAK